MAAFDYTTEAELFDFGAEAELFDYAAEAELFSAKNSVNRISGRQSISYRRFVRSADAVRFAIEELPPELLLGTCLEVDEKRYGYEGIRRLYESANYPLPRRAVQA